jgi:DNA-binding CsgD family transcriptional regulator
VASGELFGRTGQLAAIHAAAARARDGAAQLVTITGEAGIGKSALVDAAVAELGGGSWTVARIALSSVEAQLGWAGLRLLCDQLGSRVDGMTEPARAAIAAAVGRSTVAPTDVDSAQVAFATAELLAASAGAGPLALVVDDLHWLDGATAAAIAFAIRATAGRPLLSLLAHRPVDLPLDPARLLDTDRRTSIELDGLSVPGVHRLLRERTGLRLGRPDAIRVHAATGGSPLHIMEIGRLVAGGVALDEALVHPSAHDVLLARVRQLPDDTRRVLLTAALAARPTLAHVQAVTVGLDAETALEAAAAQGLADVRRGTIEFAHPLVRAAVVAGATGAARRIARRALAAGTDDPDERVLLLEAATDGPDAVLAADLDAASARAAERGDLLLAARFARWAAERTSSDHVDARVDRLLGAAELAAASGDLQLPVELADEAVTLSTDLDVSFRAAVTKALTVGNRGEQSATLAILAEQLVLQTGRPLQCTRLHDIRAQVLLAVDVPAGLEAARASLAEARATGDAGLVERALALVDMTNALAGGPVDFDELQARCERLPLAGIARDWCVSTLNVCDLAEASFRQNVLQLAEYQRLGLVHFEAPTRARMLADLVTLGRYREALAHAQACLDLHEMIGGPASCTFHADVAFVTTLLGDAQAVEARAAAGREVAASDDTIDKVAAIARFGQLAVVLGAWDEAADRVDEAGRLAERVGLDRSGVVAYRTDGAEALIQLGRLDAAERLLAELEAVNARSRLPRGPADSARCRALLAAARGDADAAVALGRAAAAAYRAIDFPLEAGRALHSVGVTLRRAGRRTEAAEALGQARQLFERIETPTLVARVDAEIERLGAKRSGSATALTPTEQQIADLVAAGRSNAEIAATLIVSLRTVESNLTRVYRKYGVRSRTELAAAMRDR